MFKATRIEQIALDLYEAGVIDMFQGISGSNPMSLSGASTSKLWLKAYDNPPTGGEDNTHGQLLAYVSGDATNEDNWSELTPALLAAHLVNFVDADLTAIAALAKTDGNVIVGDGSTWVAESGATARASLGVTIGTHVQAWDTDLDAIAALSPSNDDVIQRKAGAWINRTMAQLIADLAALGTTFQPLDSDLTSWAGVTRASGFDTFAATPSLANLGSLLTDDASGLITFMTTPSSANLKALVTDETGSGGSLVFATGPTIASPAITTSPTAAGATWTDLGTVTTADINGGTVDGAVVGGSSAAAGTFTTLTATTSNLQGGTATLGTVAGAIDMGGATSLEIPNDAAPTVNADGEIALDTSVTDWSHGIMKYYGGEELAVVAMPVAQLGSPQDGAVPTYVAASDEFQLTVPAGGGTVTSITASNGVVSSTGAAITTSGTIYAGPLGSGGRLTLVTGTPVMTTTQASKTTVYYTPYKHNLIPIFDGTIVRSYTFTELSIAMAGDSDWAANTNFDVFLGNDAGTFRLCTVAWGSDTARSSTNVLHNGQGFFTNDTAFTARYNGTTTFTCPQYQGTYLGTFRTNGSAGTTEWIYGALASGGTAGSLLLWNMYNRVQVWTSPQDSTANWTYGSTTIRAANNSSTIRVSYVSGLAEDMFIARSMATAQAGAAGVPVSGVGYDATNAFNGTVGVGPNGSTNIGSYGGEFGTASLGFHFMSMNEQINSANNQTIFGTGTLGASQTGLVLTGWF